MSQKPTYEALLERVNVQERELAELRTTRDTLKESEDKYRKLVEQATDAILMIQDRRTIYRNRAWENLLGYSVDETLEKSFLDFIAEEDRERVRGYHENRLKGLPAPTQYEVRIKARNGQVLTMEARPFLTTMGGRPAAMVVMRDLTERRKVEAAFSSYHEKLRSLASQLALAEERERRRISNQVHDQIGQNLAFAQIRLGELIKQMPSPGLADSVAQVRRFIDLAIEDTRALVSELGAPILYELGFVPAVEGLARDAQKSHGIVIRFADDGQLKPLSQEIQLLLYQAVRELLANMVKHSRAGSGSVSVGSDGGEIRIEVEDTGIGFDLEKIDNSMGNSKGYGLFSIKERLEPFGGKVALETRPGHGTRVVLTAPLGIN